MITVCDVVAIAVIALCGIGAFYGPVAAALARLAEWNDRRKGRLS